MTKHRRARARRGGLVAVAATLALVGAACGADDGGDTASGGDRTIDMTMTDNAFAPKRVEVAAGSEVTFRFTNDGDAVHEAFIGDMEAQEGHHDEMMAAGEDGKDDGGGHGGGHGGGRPDAVTVQPGETAELTHRFAEAGEVVIGCHEPGHWEAGMMATVVVQ